MRGDKSTGIPHSRRFPKIFGDDSENLKNFADARFPGKSILGKLFEMRNLAYLKIIP